MKDKEKQIEKMFNYLRECSNNAWAKGFDYAEIDNEKLRAFLDLFPKDSVVLSKEKYETLKRLSKSSNKIGSTALEGLYMSHSDIENIVKQARKETAEKIFNHLLGLIWEYPYRSCFRENDLKEFAKQFGVEIKE